MITFLLVICLLGIYSPLTRTEEGIQVDYLGQVNRLNGSTEFTDVYFSCSLRGSFLHWQFNHIQLRVFLMGEVGRTFVVPGDNFNYTATLLSSRPITNDTTNEALDSVLVITFLDTPPSQFQVTCTSNNQYLTRSFRSNNSTGSLNANGTVESVLLDFVLSNRIVQNINHTYVFVCGVAFDQQLINASGSLIGFSSQDEVGKTKTHLSRNRRTTEVLGILIFRDSNQITSLIFIPRNSEVEVVCSSGSYNRSLFTNTDRATSAPSSTTGENVPTAPASSHQSDNKPNDATMYHTSMTTGNINSDIKKSGAQGYDSFITLPTRKTSGGRLVVSGVISILVTVCLVITAVILPLLFHHKRTIKECKKEHDISGENGRRKHHKCARYSTGMISTSDASGNASTSECELKSICEEDIRDSSKPEGLQNEGSHSARTVAEIENKKEILQYL